MQCWAVAVAVVAAAADVCTGAQRHHQRVLLHSVGRRQLHLLQPSGASEEPARRQLGRQRGEERLVQQRMRQAGVVPPQLFLNAAGLRALLRHRQQQQRRVAPDAASRCARCVVVGPETARQRAAQLCQAAGCVCCPRDI